MIKLRISYTVREYTHTLTRTHTLRVRHRAKAKATTKCVWHNNHESRQRLWTPISKSCDSFLFTFAPDVRRCRSPLAHTHANTHKHIQTPTVLPLPIDKLGERARERAKETQRAN